MQKNYFISCLLLMLLMCFVRDTKGQGNVNLSVDCGTSRLNISGSLTTSNGRRVNLQIYKDNQIVSTVSDLVGPSFNQSVATSGSGSYFVKALEVNNDGNNINSPVVAVNCSGSTQPSNPSPQPSNPNPSATGVNLSVDCGTSRLNISGSLTTSNGRRVNLQIYKDNQIVSTVSDLVGPSFNQSVATSGSGSYFVKALEVNNDGNNINSPVVAVNCSGSTQPSNPSPQPSNPNPSTNPAGSNLAGTLDEANCNIIGGWVLDRNSRGKSTKVDLYLNGWLVSANIPATKSRQDVADAYGISGYNSFGFSIIIPRPYRVGVALTVSVKYAGTNTDIPGSPKTTPICDGGNVSTNGYCRTDNIARVFPGAEPTVSSIFSHSGSPTIQLSKNKSRGTSVLTSKLIPVNKGQSYTLDAYASRQVEVKKNNIEPAMASIVGAVAAGLSMENASIGNLEGKSRYAQLPFIGVTTVFAIPLIKNLLRGNGSKQKGMMELSFYSEKGQFICRQQSDIDGLRSKEWEMFHLEGHAPEKGYAVIRLQNMGETSLYFSDVNLEFDRNESSSKNDFVYSRRTMPSRVQVNENNTYHPNATSGNCTDGAVVDGSSEGIRFIGVYVNVTAPAPNYSYATGGNIMIGGSSSGGSGAWYDVSSGGNGNPGAQQPYPSKDRTDEFKIKLEEEKKFFCDLRDRVLAEHGGNTPNWNSPGQPGSSGNSNGVIGALLGTFLNQVASGAPWDLKAHGWGQGEMGEYSVFNGGILRFDDYGNIGFGIAAAAMGIPESTAACAAGLYQMFEAATKPGKEADFNNFGGCGDDRRDTDMIKYGYSLFQGCGNQVSNKY